MKAKATITILGWILGLVSTHAYDFTEDFENGIYWRSFPVTFEKYVSSTSEGSVLDSLVAQAEGEWEDAVGSDVWTIPDGHHVSSSYSGNVIRWSDNFAAETGYSPTSTLAVTVRHRVGTYFSKVEIILNGENSRLRANTSNILYQTILHEMGHTIGIDHSQYTSAVMYASLQGINSLSNDDQNAVVAVVDEAIYRQSTGYVSALAAGDDSNGGNMLACGSVALVSENNNGPGSGAATVILGFMLVLLFQKVSQFSRLTRQTLPIR